MKNYEALTKKLKQVLKVAKRLGLTVTPGGGYAMSYTINRLPPYPVGLIGALTIIEGEGARGKLGLNFDETMALEAGFNGFKNKKFAKNKKYPELEAIGVELSKAYAPREVKFTAKKASLENYYGMGAAPASLPETLALPTQSRRIRYNSDFMQDDDGFIAAIPEPVAIPEPTPEPAQAIAYTREVSTWSSGTSWGTSGDLIMDSGGSITITGGTAGLGYQIAASVEGDYGSTFRAVAVDAVGRIDTGNQAAIDEEFLDEED